MATTTTSTSATSGIPMAETANPNKGVGKKELDKSDFMKLFITQLQYQDPMKPMDSNEMASQLAQFSSMEATMKMADNMQKMLDYQTSQNNLQQLSLIGRDVRAKGDSIGVSNGEASKAFFELKDAVDTCTVNIYDMAGHQVKNIEMGSTGSGLHTVEWNGMDYRGQTVPDGAYTFSVVAMTPLGKRADVETQSVGKVTGVSFASGTATLTLDNHASIGLSEIMEVLQPQSGTTATDKTSSSGTATASSGGTTAATDKTAGGTAATDSPATSTGTNTASGTAGS